MKKTALISFTTYILTVIFSLKKVFYILIIFPLLSHSQYVFDGWEKEEVSYHNNTNIIKSFSQISKDRGNNLAQRFRYFYDKNSELIKVDGFEYDSFEEQLKDTIQNSIYSVYWDSEVKFASNVKVKYYKNGNLYHEVIYDDFYGWYLKKNFKGEVESVMGDWTTPALNGVVSNYWKRYNDYERKKFETVLKAKTLFIHNQPIVREFYNSNKSILPNEEVEIDYTSFNKYDHPFPNEYDIKSMVILFFEDIFATNNFYGKPSDLITKLEDNKNTVYNNIVGLFESLDGDTLAQSYGMDNDDLVLIKIDSKKWAKASSIKRWYILYHELGHDILNLRHGQGGKMMYPFPLNNTFDIENFIKDRDYMFKSFLN